jgi:DNA-binding winged helix-turn-helix (wHTH) protein/Tfp pilus assembly protein PilF
MPGRVAPVHRFGPFELDARSGELTRSGRRVALPRQAFLLLDALLEAPGEVVARDALGARLWPADLHVDREHGLNNAAARLRRALGDPASASRFVETLPRVGYRFVAPVSRAARDSGADAPRPARGSSAAQLLGAACVFIAGFGAGALMPARVAEPLPALEAGASRQARQHAERSLTYTRLVLDGVLPAGHVYPAARAAAARALELDPSLADAHLAAGYAEMWGRWDWAAADAAFGRALARDPLSARARHAQALWLSAHGRAVEARAAIARALELDPLAADMIHDAARLALAAGDAPAAVARLRPQLDRRPDDARAHELMSDALASLGRNADAARHFQRFLLLAGVAADDARDAADVLASGGMSSLIRRKLSRPSGKPLDRHGVPFKLASSYAAVGDVEAALAWLREAVDQRDSQLLFVRVNPRFASLWGDPRFEVLVDAVGL